MAKETIKDFSNIIIGYVDTDSKGNKTATDFYGRIVGYYDKQANVTTDFYRIIRYRGDAVVSLIYEEDAKYKAEEMRRRN